MTPLEEANGYLAARGVLSQTAAEFQVETVVTPNHEQLNTWLGYDGYTLEAAIVFPNLMVDPDTAAIAIHNYAVRCFPPPVWADGKERKFLSTRGPGYRPYILPPVLDHAFDTSRAIYIVEKQTAALLLYQNGFSAIAFDGTWGAAETRKDDQPVKFHPVLAEFDWIGRPVYLCFDSDFRARTNVLWGLIRAYLLFSVAGAVVRLVQWDSAFKGVEDYTAAKAGLDPAAQRLELNTLTATVSGLSADVVAGNWVIPQYRTLFEREMTAIKPGMAERSQLAECLHEALGTTAGDLKKSWGAATKPAPPKERNTPTYPIPEVCPEPVNYSEVMFGVLSDFTNPRFVVITPEQAVVCTIHTMTTYLTEYLDDWLHFLYVTAGAKESGKTKLLCLFFELCYWASLRGDPTAPAIYYDLKEGPHTMLIDEVDKKEQNREAILDLINYSTTRRTAWVSRVDMDAKRVVYFPTFCPKILAGIGLLRGTTASRCIEIQMLKKPPGGPRIRIKKDDRRKFEERRSQMMRIATEIGPGLADYDIDTLRLPAGISDREADNWTLLFLTAELIGGPWPGLLRRAFATLCPPKNPDASDDSDGTEYGEALVRDLARIWVETPAVEFYLGEQLLIKLKSMKDRPWAGMRNGLGISSEKMADLLRAFPGVKPFLHRVGQGKRQRGYFLVHLLPIFQSYAADIWNSSPPPDDPFGESDSPPEPADPSGEGPSPTAQKPPEEPPREENKEKSSFEGAQPVPPVPPSENQVPEPMNGVERVKKENAETQPVPPTCSTLNPSESTLKRGVERVEQVAPPENGVCLNFIPPATPQAAFCIATHPERRTDVDLETFYPFSDEYPQPSTFTTAQLATRQREGKAHPYASDPRRCVARLLTIWDDLGTFGPKPLVIDMVFNPVLPPEVLDALANTALCGHNLDFDLTVLRRYGISVSNQIVDTLVASRLLGLGKSKLSFDTAEYSELSLAEIEEMEMEAEVRDPNPVAHDLAAAVQRYLGITMDKATTHLGASDWGRRELTPEQLAYAVEDVALLGRLWNAIEQELEKAELRTVFAARMEFAVHLNEIKMLGIPVDTKQLTAEDLPRATAEKEKSGEELTQIFSELSFEIPKSRKKKLKIKNEEGKTKFVSGPTHEGFRPSCRNQHWIPALASHGIYLEDTKAPTLRRADKPECWALLKYASTAKRLSEIVGIARESFPDGRVRAETWNQLAAVTGRIISRRPNLQQVPNEYRGPFRVAEPWIWLKGDLEQIEMLILAIVTQDPNLIALLLAHKDAYVEYGARIFGKKAERGPGEDQVTEALRKIAKIPTLGTSYGMTPFGFVRQLRDELGIEYSIEQAEEFFEVFFEMFPGIAAYHARANEEAAFRLDVRTIAGTRRWLPPLVGEPSDDWELNKEYARSLRYRKNTLLNTPIQGSGADLVIWAVNQFVPQLPAPVQIINLVHDEVDALVSRETMARTIELITKAFRDVFAKFYPDSPLTPSIKFSVGPSWGELQPV